MRKSIRTRLTINFMLIIIITVLILEIALINGVRNYYYSNVENILVNEINFSIDYYLRYFSSTSIEDIILDDIDVFWKHTSAQVQVLDSRGALLLDSLGASQENLALFTDVKKAMDGQKGNWIGRVAYYKNPIMAVSMPIIVQDNSIGIIRFITTLKETNETIRIVSLLLVGMGLIVIFISGMVSIFLANSIVKPLQELTRVAEKMAGGQLKARSNIKLKDEIGQLSHTLNYMAEELIKREEIKNDFISAVSHELRTPLTSIKGWAATLKLEDFGDNEIFLDGLDIIENETDRLSNMVEELLDFSQFVSGRIKLDKDVFNIKNTLSMIGKQLSPRAKNHRIDFSLNIDEDIGLILADENRIKQVLINLLDNAFKFTSQGGKVILNAFLDEKKIILEVVDNGIGIDIDDLPRIKEKFYKGRNSKSHSGIGLSICDEIIKLHEGSMEISSVIDKGTKVRVILPYQEDSI